MRCALSGASTRDVRGRSHKCTGRNGSSTSTGYNVTSQTVHRYRLASTRVTLSLLLSSWTRTDGQFWIVKTGRRIPLPTWLGPQARTSRWLTNRPPVRHYAFCLVLFEHLKTLMYLCVHYSIYDMLHGTGSPLRRRRSHDSRRHCQTNEQTGTMLFRK